MIIRILKWWNAWICKCLVLICRVKQKPLPPVSREVVKVVTVKMVVSVSYIQVAFVLSCKDRRWLLSSVKPVCYSSAYFHHCASSWWFSVCLCWTVSVIWMLLHHSPTDCPLREGAVACRRLTKFKSWAEVCSPPHWWCWRSSSHHGLVGFAGVDLVEMPVLLWRWKVI